MDMFFILAKKYKKYKKVYTTTSHNRTIYAVPPVGDLASIRLGQSLRSFPRLIAAHAVPRCGTDASPGRASCGSDAAQNPYSGWQNVINSRNDLFNREFTIHGTKCFFKYHFCAMK